LNAGEGFTMKRDFVPTQILVTGSQNNPEVINDMILEGNQMMG
jgi:hypothetical protein